MERLLQMDKEQFISQMLEDARRFLGQVADAVNGASDGAVINASEVTVRDAGVELQRRAFEKAVQMRIDSTESSFSPSQGRGGQVQEEQGPVGAKHAEPRRPPGTASHPVVRQRRRKR